MEQAPSLFRKLRHRRGWFTIAFVAIISPLCAVIATWPLSFYASGTVIISNLEPADSSLSAAIQKLGDPADLASQLVVAKSPRMIRLALERPGVFQAITAECNYDTSTIYLLFSPDCGTLKPGSRELLKYVSSRYSVKAEGRSRIISIGYSSRLPEVSFALANALLLTYLEDQRGENARSREAAISWLLKEQEAKEKRWLSPNFYHDLYKEVNGLETERRDLPNPARLVSLAELPLRPSSPKRLFLFLAGFLITTLLAGCLTALKDMGDRRIYLPADIRALTSEPVIFSLPRPPGRKGNHLWKAGSQVPLLDTITSNWESPLLAKAARNIYAELAVDIDGQSARRILISSATPEEGKTLTTIALARAAAESGHQVLLMNCDFLNSVQNPASINKGLASILRGKIEPQDTVIQTGLRGLDFIEAGVANTEPSLLFKDGQLPKLMDWARRYDLVLLHGPCGFVPELRTLASHAEGLLWCVRWGQTLLRDVKGDLQDLHRQRVKLLGVAVTMVDERELRYEL